MTGDDKSFYQGFAMVIAAIIREHNQPTMAVDIMRGCGVTVEQLRAAKVDGYDLRPIGRAVKSETPVRRADSPLPDKGG